MSFSLLPLAPSHTCSPFVVIGTNSGNGENRNGKSSGTSEKTVLSMRSQRSWPIYLCGMTEQLILSVSRPRAAKPHQGISFSVVIVWLMRIWDITGQYCGATPVISMSKMVSAGQFLAMTIRCTISQGFHLGQTYNLFTSWRLTTTDSQTDQTI